MCESMNRLKLIPSSALLCLLAACGGSSDQATDNPQAPAQLAATTTTSATAAVSQNDAARFLTQASFGPSPYEIGRVVSMGPQGWLDAEFRKSQSLAKPYFDTWAAQHPGNKPSDVQFYEIFWRNAVMGDDHLRQRVTYALSQIFVVSMQDSDVSGYPRGVGSYYDTLGKYAFGNFRDLLQAVTLHPMMGIYLSHMRNKKEDGNRLPDENFAREIMQLFTIGLYQLNQDGTRKLSNGQPIETYTHADVAGLAKVFTGWAWYGPDTTTHRFNNGTADPNRDVLPMQNYTQFHSTSNKTFLGASTNGSGSADMKVALDKLFNHPNVGPFIGRQLIQRLVTSNPSPSYVSRVAAAFNNNGSGVRGDMKTVLSAVLLDPEARTLAADADSGKLREPILRLANWMRAFNARSTSGRFLMWSLEDPLTGLSQQPMRSPSVFNFYRPGYAPPNTSIAAAGKVSPEMQITGEPSVIGYLNLVQAAVQSGVGENHDILPNYSAEIDMAATPDRLLDRVNLLLLGGRMSSTLRGQIKTVLNSIAIPTAGNGYTSAGLAARRNRVYAAIFLTMASPEYIVEQ
jgi:uncharacterized protein (DUF1800 family)